MYTFFNFFVILHCANHFFKHHLYKKPFFSWLKFRQSLLKVGHSSVNFVYFYPANDCKSRQESNIIGLKWWITSKSQNTDCQLFDRQTCLKMIYKALSWFNLWFLFSWISWNYFSTFHSYCINYQHWRDLWFKLWHPRWDLQYFFCF